MEESVIWGETLGARGSHGAWKQLFQGVIFILARGLLQDFMYITVGARLFFLSPQKILLAASEGTPASLAGVLTALGYPRPVENSTKQIFTLNQPCPLTPPEKMDPGFHLSGAVSSALGPHSSFLCSLKAPP